MPRAYWPVHVDSPGTYRVELRLWPVEADTPIQAACKTPRPINGVERTRAAPAVAFKAKTATPIIGDEAQVVHIDPTDKAATFQADLEKGSTRVSGFFHDGEEELDAFFVHVIRG